MEWTEHQRRIDAATDAIRRSDFDALVVGIGADLEYLVGYQAHELERLSVLVLQPGRSPVMVIPELEAPGFPVPDRLELRAWSDGSDPIALLTDVLGGAVLVAVSDSMRAHFVLPMQDRGLQLGLASSVLAPLRSVKSAGERELLRAAGAAADRVTTDLMEGGVSLVGRTEMEVALDIRNRLVDAGHDTAQFAIVASGPNSASPHHAPGGRRIERGEVVLFDIGGRLGGYHSDTTRCVHTGPVPSEVEEAWQVLVAAQRAAADAAVPGASCEAVDRAAREVIAEAGHGDRFIHRTGHGIGLQGHEDPYIVEGNRAPLEVGNAFSIEPGIYLADRWGLRLEDIVVLDDDGLTRCNEAPRQMVEV